MTRKKKSPKPEAPTAQHGDTRVLIRWRSALGHWEWRVERFSVFTWDVKDEGASATEALAITIAKAAERNVREAHGPWTEVPK